MGFALGFSMTRVEVWVHTSGKGVHKNGLVPSVWEVGRMTIEYSKGPHSLLWLGQVEGVDWKGVLDELLCGIVEPHAK